MLVAMVALMAGFGFLKAKSTNHSISTIYDDRVLPLKQLKIVNDMYAANIVDAANKAATGLKEPTGAAKQVADATAQAAEQWKAYTATFLTDEEKRVVAHAVDLMIKAQPVVAQLHAALAAGDKDKVTALVKPVYEAIDPLGGVLQSLVDIQLKEAKAEFDRAQKPATATIRHMV